MSSIPKGTPAAATDIAQNMIERVCVGDITTRSADLYPDRVAIVDGERRMTYRELDRQANRLGQALLGLGLEHGDVVGVVSRNSIEQLVTYFACAKAGLICAPRRLPIASRTPGPGF